MPPNSREWTVDDLASLPDDGLQYELLDGILLVSPGPILRHQVISARLHRVLTDACPDDLLALYAPFDWRPDRRTSLQPDLFVIPNEKYDTTSTDTLLLAIEILSPSTRSKGVPSYWIVDPDGPSITALELVDSRYVVAGEAKADEPLDLSQPLDVTITPTALIC